MIEKRSDIGPEASSARLAEQQIQREAIRNSARAIRRSAVRRKSRLAMLAAIGNVIDLYGSRRFSAVKKRRRSFSDDTQNIAGSFQAAISKVDVSFLADSNADSNKGVQ